jgi:hypothetical protein
VNRHIQPFLDLRISFPCESTQAAGRLESNLGVAAGARNCLAAPED